MKSIFLVIFRPGSGWLPGKPLAEQPLGEHVKHHLGLFEKGIVKFAGPFTDDTGGAAVMEASSLEEINGMISLDPAVTNKVFAYDIRPWSLIAGERYVPVRPFSPTRSRHTSCSTSSRS